MDEKSKHFLRNSAFGPNGQCRMRPADIDFFKLWTKPDSPRAEVVPGQKDIKPAAVLKPVEALLTEIDKRMPWACFVGSSIRCEGHGFRTEVVLRFFHPSPDTGDVLTGIFLDSGYSDVIVSSGIVSGDNPVEEWEFTVSGLYERRTEDEQG